jgi:H+/gluconate symporter-like permease
MSLIAVAASIVLLLVPIARLKVNAFLALLPTAFVVGVANGMAPAAALQRPPACRRCISAFRSPQLCP